MKFDGFNGQRARQDAFKEITRLCRFGLIVETGTQLGESSGYMYDTCGLPVLTCDIIYDNVVNARNRLKGLNVKVFEWDSRAFLRDIANTYKGTRIFFYLDAHWYDKDHDLPLAEEVEIIMSNWEDYVIVIDDFQVPTDGGYGFDKEKEWGVLNLDLIAPSITKHHACVYFPSCPSNEDTGSKRGSVTLCGPGSMERILSTATTLRKAP